MNKKELAAAVSNRIGNGNLKDATEALDAVLDTIQAAVAKGEKVAILGFGSFEKQDRPAREARNPATGEPIKVAATSVPKFKAGADFKKQVAAGS